MLWLPQGENKPNLGRVRRNVGGRQRVKGGAASPSPQVNIHFSEKAVNN